MSDSAAPVASPLQFGLFDWVDDAHRDVADIYEERLKMLEYADKAGFYAFHLAEHHGTPLNLTPSPGIFLAAAAQRTKRIRLGSLVHLLPLYHPMRLIQEICMLDHLTRGRLELGVGRGVNPYELASFDLDAPTAREMFREALQVVITGLREGEINFEGKYYSFKNVTVHMRPLQRPYPPLWYPTSNVESVGVIAKEGYNTVLHYMSLDEMRDAFDTYKRVQVEERDNPDRLNAHVKDPKYGIVHHVYVAESDKEAMTVAKAAFGDFFTNFSHMGRTKGAANEAYQRRLDWQGDFEGRLADGWYVVGSPATVRESIQRQVAATGANYFVGAFSFGTLTGEQTLRSLHLFTKEVMPALSSGNLDAEAVPLRT
jgi:alkanesulfonate monooxygenase SsuD/methylene tetrahydromethanopterin reductase-like flavin-dependent oxidoreductase (luciferase family)